MQPRFQSDWGHTKTVIFVHDHYVRNELPPFCAIVTLARFVDFVED